MSNFRQANVGEAASYEQTNFTASLTPAAAPKLLPTVQASPSVANHAKLTSALCGTGKAGPGAAVPARYDAQAYWNGRASSEFAACMKEPNTPRKPFQTAGHAVPVSALQQSEQEREVVNNVPVPCYSRVPPLYSTGPSTPTAGGLIISSTTSWPG